MAGSRCGATLVEIRVLAGLSEKDATAPGNRAAKNEKHP